MFTFDLTQPDGRNSTLVSAVAVPLSMDWCIRNEVVVNILLSSHRTHPFSTVHVCQMSVALAEIHRLVYFAPKLDCQMSPTSTQKKAKGALKTNIIKNVCPFFLYFSFILFQHYAIYCIYFVWVPTLDTWPVVASAIYGKAFTCSECHNMVLA